MVRHASCTLFLTQFCNFWYITHLSINTHRQVMKAQISMLNSYVTVKFGRISGMTNIYENQAKNV